MKNSPSRLHTIKNISSSPALQIRGVFCIDVDQGSLINEKNWKIALPCFFFFFFFFFFFCGGYADLSKHTCVKGHFYQELRDLGAFRFVPSTAI